MLAGGLAGQEGAQSVGFPRGGSRSPRGIPEPQGPVGGKPARRRLACGRKGAQRSNQTPSLKLCLQFTEEMKRKKETGEDLPRCSKYVTTREVAEDSENSIQLLFLGFFTRGAA